MKGCCGSVVQTILVIVNIIWAISSVVTALIGTVLWNVPIDESKSETTMLLATTKIIGFFALLVGFVGLMLALAGCVGAWRKKVKMMNTYAVLLAIIAVCELGVGLTALVCKDKPEPIIKQIMQAEMDNYGKEGYEGNAAVKFWDAVQSFGQCCGLDSYTDFPMWHLSGPPDSCCKEPRNGNDCNFIVPANVNTQGCLPTFSHGLAMALTVIGVMSIVSAGLKIGGSICACSLVGEILKERAEEEDRHNLISLQEGKDTR